MLSAKLGYDLHTRLLNVYGKSTVDSLLGNKADKTAVVTALGANGNYLTWTKNGAVNNITVPYATIASKIYGATEHTGTALSNFDIEHTLTYQASNNLGDGISYSAILSVSAGSVHRFFQIIGGKGDTNFLKWRTTNGDATAMGSVRRLLDDVNYASVLDGRYYTESEINTKLAGYQAKGNYVTTDTAQTISGAKTFTSYIFLRWGSATKGLYFSGDSNGNVGLSAHENNSYTADAFGFGRDGRLTANSFTKRGGTSSQFLKADGSVDGTSYLPRSGGSMTNTNVVTNLNADLLDGKHNGEVTAKKLTVVSPTIIGVTVATAKANFLNAIKGAAFGNVTVIESSLINNWNSDSTTVVGSSGYSAINVTPRYDGNTYGQFLLFHYASYNPKLIGRNNGAWTAIKTFAFIDDNVASATKLQTARTINGTSFDGTANITTSYWGTARTLWGQSCNGSANISGSMTGVGSISMNGDLVIDKSAPIIKLKGRENGSTIQFYASDNTYRASIQFQNNYGPLEIKTGSDDIYLAPGNVVRVKTSTASYALNTASFICDSWIRTKGATGWYNETYGGGWYMTDSTYIKNYNSKRLKIEGINDYYAVWLSSGGFCCEGYAGTLWNEGYGALNIGIVNNSNQTPLMVAYRNGTASAHTGANRLFALELLNSGTTLHFGFGGASKFDMNSAGVFHAVGGIYSDGYVSARGQNTSDIRLKEDIKDFRATDIIKALRPVQFKWNATARSKFPVLDTDAPQYGLIAQEAEKTAPWLVDRKMFDDGYWGVRYDKLIPVLLKGQQETIRDLMQIDNSLLLVTRKTETLEQRVTRLEAENRELRKKIELLTA